MQLRIATRRSALALWQAEHVAAQLTGAHPGLEIELVPMTTRGDEIQDVPLASLGGKGLFLKELEVALLERRADIAVHSMKDVPMTLEPEFEIAAVLARADPFDAFVSNRHASLGDVPAGARIGTSSLRRQAQLRALRRDVEPVDLRGNLNTRLAKLDAGQFDAVILACAGLARLGFEHRIRARLDAPEWLPAAAQGAIGVECRAGDTATEQLLAPLADPPTTIRIEAERAMTRRLQGSCQVPIAAYAVFDGDQLHLSGLVGDAATGELVRAQASGSANEAASLGETVATMLLERGAGRLLGVMGRPPDPP